MRFSPSFTQGGSFLKEQEHTLAGAITGDLPQPLIPVPGLAI